MKQQRLTKTAIALTLATIIGSPALLAEQSFKTVSPAVTSLEAPADIEKKAVVYLWPEPQQAKINVQLTQQIESNEYWQSITGEELNKGVALYADNSALVRLAPGVNRESGAPQVSSPLEMTQLVIEGKETAITQLMAQKDLQAAGFHDGSVALTVKNTSAEPMMLRSSQKLDASATYMVHVKEKQSPHKLAVSAPRLFDANQHKTLSLDANISGVELNAKNTQVSLIAPDGGISEASLHKGNIAFKQPLSIVGAYQGFYEVQLSSLVNIDGQWVKRSVKMPFTNMAKTAALALDTAQVSNTKASLVINVFEPGRYNVTATLQGTDKAGNTVRLQTLDTAQWLSRDKTVSLPFEFDKFDRYHNLELVDVKLTDQSRLMTLQYQESL